MALHKKITNSQYEGLEDHIKALYVKDGPNYKLDLEGDEGVTQADVDNALQAKNHEKAERLKLQKELNDLKASGEGKGAEAESLRTQLAELTERLNLRDNALKSSAIKVAATELTKLAKSPRLFEPHVLKRLSAELDESGNAVVKVLDADGKVSKATLQELGEEFKKDKDFASLMLGSASSGGDGGLPTDPTGNNKQVKNMSEQERVAWAKTDPEGFKAAVAAAQTTSA